MTTKRSTKEKLLEAAAILFYNQGITATGIQAITERAGVAKMSLYNNFESKSALVAAYLEARHNEWLDLYEKRLVLNNASSPSERILAIFDAYEDHARWDYENGFRGCGLLNAAAEFPAGSLERETVRRHKESIETMIFEALFELTHDSERAQLLAKHLSFLLEGAIMRAGLECKSDKTHEAREIAASLLAEIKTLKRS